MLSEKEVNMGHEIGIRIVTAPTLELLRKKVGEVEESVAETISHDDNGFYDYYNIGSLKDTCKHYDSQKAAVDELYDMADVTGRDYSYYATFDFPRSSKYIALEKRLEDEIQKKDKYAKEHAVASFKAKFVGCEFCSSKINKSYLKKANDCPVCGNDLRSKTTIDTLSRYSNNIYQLRKDLDAEAKAMQTQRTQKKNTAKYYCCAVFIDRHC